jgi:hypothetical protein
MLTTFDQVPAAPMPPPLTIRKRATAEEIRADLQDRIERQARREGNPPVCAAPLPRPSRVDRDGAPNWTVDGFPGLVSGGFGTIVRIVDQARLEYELVP